MGLRALPRGAQSQASGARGLRGHVTPQGCPQGQELGPPPGQRALESGQGARLQHVCGVRRAEPLGRGKEIGFCAGNNREPGFETGRCDRFSVSEKDPW